MKRKAGYYWVQFPEWGYGSYPDWDIAEWLPPTGGQEGCWFFRGLSSHSDSFIVPIRVLEQRMPKPTEMFAHYQSLANIISDLEKVETPAVVDACKHLRRLLPKNFEVPGI